MATYSLSGRGSHALTANTTALEVTVTTVPAHSSFGSANPSNRYDVGLLRFGDGTGFGIAIPILGGPQRVDVPTWATSVSYSLFGSGVVQVVEVLATSGGNWQKQPLDRNPASISAWQSWAVPATPTDTTLWTYTVPAARMAQIYALNGQIIDFGALTQDNWISCSFTHNSLTFQQAYHTALAQGVTELFNALSGPMLLLPGETISAGGHCSYLTGSAYVFSGFAGFTFDQ